ncbi:Putative ribonuclease H protein At1g65750, partial [Linum grandiflorum]
FIHSSLDEALALGTQFTPFPLPPRRDVSISGVSADHPWSTLNTDDSVIPSENRAAVGGIIRDAQGRMLVAFAASLGTCTVTRAEMSGVIDDMERAWSHGVSHLEVQLDSLAAISLFQAGGSCDHQHANLAVGSEVSETPSSQLVGSVALCVPRGESRADFWPIMTTLWLLEGTRYFYPMSLLADDFCLIISDAELHER